MRKGGSGFIPEQARGKPQIDGRLTAYVCRERTCSPPMTTFEAVIAALDDLGSRGSVSTADGEPRRQRADARHRRTVAVAAVSAKSSGNPAVRTTIVNRPARAAQRTLKTVVFNARTGARFDGILACLRRPPLADADVIMLCEADWRTAPIRSIARLPPISPPRSE